MAGDDGREIWLGGLDGLSALGLVRIRLLCLTKTLKLLAQLQIIGLHEAGDVDAEPVGIILHGSPSPVSMHCPIFYISAEFVLSCPSYRESVAEIE